MNTVEITVTLTEAEAWELAQFLKRVCFSDYRSCATSDALVQKRVLHDIELLAASVIAPALQRRHLMRELVDLQLLEFDFCIAPGEDCRVSGIEIGELCVAISKSFEKRRGQISQLRCVHFIEPARQLHALDTAIFAAISTYFSALFPSQNTDLGALIESLPRQPHDDRLKLCVFHAMVNSVSTGS